MSDLLHLENIREQLVNKAMGHATSLSPLAQEFMDLLKLVENVIVADDEQFFDTVSELEEWAR